MAYIKSQQERISNGLCKECGTPRGEGGTSIRCIKCAKDAARRSTIRTSSLRALWKNGEKVCSSCGKHNEDYKDFKNCKSCRTYSKNYRESNLERTTERKIKNGICRCCSKPSIKKRCKSCWTKDLLRKHGINVNLWEVFWKKLEDQKFTCFYTGIEIFPEINASLDHIIPKSKGGTNDLNNLVWCDRKINSFKNDNDYESLIKICSLILENHQQRELILN